MNDSPAVSHRLNNAFILLLTLFCGGCCVLWARSLRYAEGVEIVWSKGSCLATSHPGELRVCWPSPVVQSPLPARIGITTSSSPRSDDGAVATREKARPRFTCGIVAVSGTATEYVQVPFWPVALASGSWPAGIMLWRTRRRWRTHARGLCRVCGYDLRATPQRCPECGTPAGRAPAGRRWRAAVTWATVLCGLLLSFVWAARHDFRDARCRPVDLATLAGFKFDPQHGTLADVPPPLRQLDGQRVSIEGYMIPMDQGDNITEFALVAKLFGGNFGAPSVQETVVVRVVDGRCLRYCPDAIRIAGTLHVHVENEDGYVISIYTMTADHAELASRPAAEVVH